MQRRSSHVYIVIGFLVMMAAAGIAAVPAIRNSLTSGFAEASAPLLQPATPPAGDRADLASSFYWQPPISIGGGNPVNLDRTLLDHLSVEVCAIAGAGCTPVKLFDSQGIDSERLRIYHVGQEGPYYIVNWDTERANINRQLNYRITVTMPGMVLGSIDLSPAVYNTFGRTWPIKFIIENDPVLRVRLLRHLGRSASQIASVLKREFGLTAEQIAALLAGDLDPFTESEIQTALQGVFQNVVIPSTTKVVDDATGRLLMLFDPAGGQMVYAAETPMLKDLRPGDVLVDEPREAAPYGYLRKVISKRKSGGMIRLTTVQAKLTEAISEGELFAAGELRPAPGSELSPGLASKGYVANLDEGDGFRFQKDLDVTINFQAGDGDVSGTGNVRVQGSVYFNAGYNFGMGIEGCLAVPPVCVDRVEAWVGVEQRSRLKITGQFDGTVHKEQVIDRVPLQPIVFFIGPIPVVLVPVVNIVLGVDGEAHINFSFEAGAQSAVKVGAKWTDPDDNGRGWENISEFNPLGSTFFNADANGNINVQAYGKVDAKLLLYGVFGPGFNGSVGIGLDAATGRRPLWKVSGHIRSAVNFAADAIGFFDIGEVWSQTLLNESFTIMEAANQAPVFYNVRTGIIPVELNKQVVLGPIGNGFQGFFDVRDPDGPTPTLTVTSTLDGNIGLTYTFSTPGLRTVRVTATDSENASSSIFLAIDVRNAVPIIWVTPASGFIAAGDQFFLTAIAYDPEDGFLPCSRISWIVDAPDVRSVSSNPGSCRAAVIFGAQGSRQVRVRATDSLGGTFQEIVNVTVGPPPANRAPVIDLESFEVRSFRGPRSTDCPLGLFCDAPNGSVLFNGEAGDHVPPLYMRMDVTDPEGDPFVVRWFCQTGSQFAPVTYHDDGWASCEPLYSANEPALVYALVQTPLSIDTDGVFTLARSPAYSYTWLQRVR